VPSEGELADEWRAASDVIARREIDEAGIADDPVFQPLPEHLIPLKERFEANEVYRRGFDMVPTEILMVELDRMVVYQKHINLEFTQQLRARLGVKPTDEEVFNTCLPLEGSQQPPLKWMRTGGGTYVFVSPSNDIRYLGSMQLKPENIVNYPVPGNMAMAIGLAVGFGSNFLNAIHCENRLVLNNGSHRAFAMRELGFTHVPCIVQARRLTRGAEGGRVVRPATASGPVPARAAAVDDEGLLRSRVAEGRAVPAAAAPGEAAVLQRRVRSAGGVTGRAAATPAAAASCASPSSPDMPSPARRARALLEPLS
jgi:hypothetical protein